MSNKNIRLIIVLMSLSFLGIIIFQLYWINGLLQQKEADLDKDLNQALSSFAGSLEEAEAVSLLTNGFQFKMDQEESNGSSAHFKHITEIRITGDDSAMDTKHEKVEIVRKEGLNSRVIVFEDSLKEYDILSIDDSSIAKVRLIERFNRKKNQLSEAVNNIAIEFAFHEQKLSRRLKGLNIDSILEANMEKQGLQQLDYAFMLIDTETDSLIAGSKLDSAPKTTYTKKLLTDLEGKEQGLLSVQLKGQGSYLLWSLWPIIGISLILCVVMLFTFGFTLDRIYKQKKLSQMKSDFINNMTHEFKTPISTISLALDAIFHPTNKANQDELNRFGGIIRKENERMHRQVERLLQAAQFEKGDINLKLETIRVHEMIKELGELIVSAQNTEDSPHLHYELRANKDLILADQLHLFNAFRNLLDNAVKFSAAKAKIELRSYNEGSDLIIEVKDHGIGMSKQTMAHIFDSFYRYTEGNLHQTKGFGLGLAYVKDVLEKLGGEIWVKSKLKEGSTFFLRFKTISNE